MKLEDLPTPSLILDRRALVANLERMQARARQLNVALRPHLKTAKSADVARLAHGAGGGPITVSTLAEAAYFLEHGFTDITYAVAITPAKLAAVAELQANGADLGLLTDNLAAAAAIAERAAALGTIFPVHIEVDTGGGRGGVQPDDPLAVEIGRVLAAAPGTALRGVLTHAGHSYGCRSTDEIRAVAEQERAGVLAVATALRAAGLPCPVVSVGSTPTAMFAGSLDGVTEIRPGVYMLMDLYQAHLGVCALTDIAVSVLTAVVGHKPGLNRLLVDAGALALSQDPSLPGYGQVLEMPDLKVVAVNQEHGFIEAPAPLRFAELPVGARLRVLPNHACITAAMHHHYHVVDGTDDVVALWPRCHGW